ncbi:1-acyl-sn-glycerol-3-phosphate acyltransferase [Leptobacterium flavescens]|uniref:1-acyl-sn-glycerol-3-phosphate acyltransferase n=1 Tax=Leptobacterium flavescens TaxID=472055 RepID=A0A6P0UMX3_9FLAO|nr:lysophospholipid acyltransferase family protein [Leptobacterium flavescens]NER13199.1 1-acyl-sn-glycerol-3-phosphate acyltransferase [Leptobacterium flavescens]
MMFLLKRLFYILWRIWFYVLVAVPIVLLFPVLLILSSREKFYPQFFWLARNVWANVILYGMGFVPKIKMEEPIEKGKSYMLIANHTSMADIMLMLKVSRNPFVFVGKKELAKMPVFGFFYKRVCIMVDRSSVKSRTAVYERAQARLDQGLSICIFPEGGVPEEDVFLDEFKDGAFRLAIEYQIPVVPISFVDNKKRFPFSFFSGSPGRMRVQTYSFISTEGYTLKDKAKLKADSRKIIEDSLRLFQNVKKVTSN